MEQDLSILFGSKYGSTFPADDDLANDAGFRWDSDDDVRKKSMDQVKINGSSSCPYDQHRSVCWVFAG